MPSQNLTITAVNNFSQTFGNAGTEYAVFDAVTKDNFPLVVSVTHNALKSAGVSLELLDNLVGSIIVLKDSTDIVTGELVTAEERIRLVRDQEINPNSGRPYQNILANRQNCSLIKGELYRTEMKDFASTVTAKVKVEKDKISQARAIANRLRNRQTVVPATAEPVLETNTEESPF